MEPVTVRVLLNRDGTVVEKPQVIKKGKGKDADLIAASVVRAVLKCAHRGESKQDPAAYDQWREMIITFDGSE